MLTKNILDLLIDYFASFHFLGFILVPYNLCKYIDLHMLIIIVDM